MTSALLLLTLSAAFEGELQMRLESPSGGGNVTLTLSSRGLRSDVEAAFQRRTLRSTLLVKVEEPDVGLALDPVRKTYQRFSLASASEAMRPQQSKAFVVEKLGVEKVSRFDCQHVRVADGQGFVAHYWVSAEVLGDDALARLVNRAAKQPASVEAALRGAGVHGLVLKLEQKSGAEEVRLELKNAISKSVPASAFEVPAGYQLTGGSVGPGASLQQIAGFNKLSPEQQKALAQRMRENVERGR